MLRGRWGTAWLLAALLLLSPPSVSAELTGRLALLGSIIHPERSGNGVSGNDTQMADQQSLRLMLEGGSSHSSTGSAYNTSSTSGEWSLHLQSSRQHSSDSQPAVTHASELFRYRQLADHWHGENDGNSKTQAGYSLDRAVYKYRFDRLNLSIGRQPVDWGSGRFWQPFNVFGAFTPIDLDTDFKPGIDALVLDYYPSAFASLTAVHAFAPQDNHEIDDSDALYFRRQVGERSELALLVARVIDNNILGAAFESEWMGLGWRFEGVHYSLKREDSLFWIAGIDYQLSDGTLLTAEWYQNHAGATTTAQLAAVQLDTLVKYGLQAHLGRQLFGLSAAREFASLWQGSYTLIVSPLKDPLRDRIFSLVHQISLVYSLSNESDLLFSMLYANGKGLNILNEPRSEFGHLPFNMTLRYRLYF